MWDPTFELARDVDQEEDGIIVWGDEIPFDGETCPFCDMPYCEVCWPLWPGDEIQEEEIQLGGSMKDILTARDAEQARAALDEVAA